MTATSAPGVLKQFKSAFPASSIQMDSVTGLPNSISGLDEKKPTKKLAATPEAAVSQVIDNPAFKALFPTILYKPRASSLERVTSYVDPTEPSSTIVTYRQQIAGIPVFGSEAKFTVTTGEVGASVSSALFSLSPVSPEAKQEHKIQAPAAQSVAAAAYSQLLEKDESFKRTEQIFQPAAPTPGGAELTMFDPAVLGSPKSAGLRPTWIVDVGSMVFFVDANTGSVVHKYRKAHSLAPFNIVDFYNGQGATVMAEGKAGPLTNIPPEASRAMQNAQKARAFFTSQQWTYLAPSTCSKNLQDPVAVELNIRVGQIQTSLWNSSSLAAYFAEGFGEEIDVVVHELMHGVTEFATCMYYDGDSGAVSEFLSDFFATVIRDEQGMNPWVIGDQVPGFAPPQDPVRSFVEPHMKGFDKNLPYGATNRGQPQSLAEYVTIDDPICATSDDHFNGCAHENSGILNHAAYLTVVGWSSDKGSAIGIGRDKMVAILKASLPYMTPTTTLSKTALLLEERCVHLATLSSGITISDCTTLTDAFKTVGLPR